jgi:hypothetical protein
LKKTPFINIIKLYNYGAYCVDDVYEYNRLLETLCDDKFSLDVGTIPTSFTKKFVVVLKEYTGMAFELDEVDIKMSKSEEVFHRHYYDNNEEQGILLPLRNEKLCHHLVGEKNKKRLRRKLQAEAKSIASRYIGTELLLELAFGQDHCDALVSVMFRLGLAYAQ